MIRNLIIIDKNSRPLVNANFGECHSLGDDDERISGFLSALYSFATILNAQSLDEIQLGTLTFFVRSKGNLVFALSADDKDISRHKKTLVDIIALFEDLFEFYSVCIGPDADITPFKEFPKFLVDQEILKPNCGRYTECKGCPNSEKTLPLDELTEGLESQHSE